ncbi:MAG: hypothetical protein C4293_06315 [Nitrospiraceae bacterium]
MDAKAIGGEYSEALSSIDRVELNVTLGIESDKVGRVPTDARPEVRTFSLLADGSVLLRMSRRPDGILHLDRLDTEHVLFRSIIVKIIKDGLHPAAKPPLPPLPADAIGQSVADLTGHTVALAEDLFPPCMFDIRKHQQKLSSESSERSLPFREAIRKLNIEYARSLVYLISSHILMPGSVRFVEWERDVKKALDHYLIPNVSELIRNLRRFISDQLGQLQYLGPLRSYPPRHVTFVDNGDPNRLVGGGRAWDIVLRNEAVRHSVNQWLGDKERLQTPYELIVRELVPDHILLSDLSQKVASALHDTLLSFIRQSAEGEGSGDPIALTAQEIMNELKEREKVADSLQAELLPMVEAILSRIVDPQSLSQKWVQDFIAAKTEPLRDLVLWNKNSRTPVSHRDVGIGISQVLPVLVTAYASTKKLLAMEQPEIHLHPALQAELGDVFIESALGDRKNTLILETHSEHLILRIMRRMRETAKNKHASGLPPVRPSDVAVLYVQADSAGSKVLELRLDDEGTLLDPWPGGFFEEGFRERFA